MVVHLPLKLSEERPSGRKTWLCSHFRFCFVGERFTTGNQVKKALESGLKQALPGAFFRLEESLWRRIANEIANAYRFC